MSQSAFETFEHTTGQRIARATGGVRLPAEVAAVVETFSGFHGFPLNPVSAPLEKENVQAAGDVTPPFLRNTYNISAVPASGKSNIQAIAQCQGQYVRDEDLLFRVCEVSVLSISSFTSLGSSTTAARECLGFPKRKPNVLSISAYCVELTFQPPA